jgi:hypothetical protein
MESLEAFGSCNDRAMKDKFFGGKYVMRFKTYTLALIAMAALAMSVAAQTLQDSGPVTAGAHEIGAMPAKAGIKIMHAEAMDAESVKGAPFCATITTEHTQPFADGNRIHTSDNSTLCRDSEGRTRREAGLNLLGASPQKSETKLITILDPVAGFHYMLDSSTKTARRMSISPSSAGAVAGRAKVAGPVGLAPKGGQVMVYGSAGMAGPDVMFDKVILKKGGSDSNEPAPVTENLGDQMIAGIHATGTRVTTTIPSGTMGNEQPIIVTSDRWFSPELKATVMTKHTDPWAGELKTQFTNMNTSEPEPSLFTVPSDYKIEDEKAGPFTIQLPPPAPAAQ